MAQDHRRAGAGDTLDNSSLRAGLRGSRQSSLGMVQITGLSVKISKRGVDTFGADILSATLVLTMVVAIVLGYGHAYVRCLHNNGDSSRPCADQHGRTGDRRPHVHLPIFACLSAITPPVALASYAACRDSRRKPQPLPVSWLFPAAPSPHTSYRSCSSTKPALLMIGLAGHISLTIATAIFGIVALAGSVEGYFFAKPTRALWQRAAL